ncbi:glycoside hydrolase family 32 protein [Streptococcus parauberis]|uniref:glycoside hydrolase family 32 protein n=1 Tax=Streptococcus parauberis TaxID=1348 RepID=UPI0002B939C8|nr:glycoside hydrolase family 32 protein [Streptococcus parauberis]EMF48535.1 Sucrose-6-phosphate hydrolase [Streptococcus parauberis KRS-02109]UWM86732.1 glycoside hydrolase family 32 protein [Streptococcus parauberis]UWM88704.1 glycoside hydrolase family 32 protein [Streptococcus parauberis]
MENPYKNNIHLEPPKGLLNDPNGLAFYQGVYYVFHQWNSKSTDHSYKEWGLFTSTDLRNWKHHGSKVTPTDLEDKDGVYSGSALRHNNSLYLFYTGNSKDRGKRKSYQKVVKSDDGQQFQKLLTNLETPKGFTEHHRDPKVWSNDKSFHMIVGGQRINGEGSIAHYQSVDLTEWQYTGEFFSSPDLDQMCECPDYFQMDGKEFLLVCPQKRDLLTDDDISSYSAYYEGYSNENKFFPTQSLQILDAGFDFYAPQTFIDNNGRRILMAWMSRMSGIEEKLCPTNKFGYLHCLTIPRELTYKNGKLLQNPVKELLDKNELIWTTNKSEVCFEHGQQVTIFDVNFEEQANKFEISLGDSSVILRYEGNKLILARKNWVSNQFEEKVNTINQLNSMKFVIDQSAVEIFINEGEMVLSLRYFISKMNKTASFTSLDKHISHLYTIETEIGYE